jgi:hypothetical protein
LDKNTTVIPKIIWQTYECSYDELPDLAKSYTQTWKNKNPNYEYRYFSNEDRRKFIVSLGDKEWIDLYDASPLGVIKAEIFRYLVIYEFGGIYVDMDTECISPIDSWIYGKDNKDYSCIFSPEGNPEYPMCMCNFAFASEAKHPIFKKIIENHKENLKSAEWNSTNFKINYIERNIEDGTAMFWKNILDYFGINYNEFDLLNNVENINFYPKVIENKVYFYGGEDFYIFRNGRAMNHFFAGDNIEWEKSWNQWKKQKL